MARYTTPIAIPAASGLISSGAGRVMGWAVRETGGLAVAHMRLWDSGSAAGKMLVPISLAADQSTRDWLGPHGLVTYQGVFFELIGGLIEGVVWVAELGDESDEQMST